MKSIVPLLAAACAVATAQPVCAQSLASWQSAVNVSAADGGLTKTAGCDGCPDAGAHSTAQLTGDGYADFVPGTGQRFFAGLSTDLSPSTVSTTLNYAFSFWPGGIFEIRELGVYKAEGSFVTGDHFSVSVESGVVVYRKNGSAVYRSAAAPTFPLVLDTSFYSPASSLSNATVQSGALPGVTVTSAAPPPLPPPPSSQTTTANNADPNPEAVATRTAVGPYLAVVDRYAYAKPPVPAIGPAGTTIQDPVFESSITRITDGNLRPGALNRSYRTPSGTHSLAWSAAGTKFYVVSTDGTVIPFTFDAATRTAKRIQPTATGDGGLVLRFYLEPQFSFVNDSVIYGSYSGSGATLRTVDKYDFSTGLYSTIFNLDTVQTGLAGTFIGGIASSAGPNERVLAFFGGTSQDKHHFVAVFDVANPSSYQVLDTLTSTLNGRPAPIPLNFSLHHATIDRSGRYVLLYPTGVDMQAPRYASQIYVWDTQTGAMTPLTGSAHPYGHDALGYGVGINQDCCTSTTWDAAQWQFRDLASPTISRDVITPILMPKETSLADHQSWNNARSDRQVPFITGLYRYGTNTTAWRAWDDEIVAVQTDAPAGASAIVWRFAHHRSDVRNDLDATITYFWYEPRPNVSPDGRWVLFTSNWEKTLGTDPRGDSGGQFRQDVFLVELASSDGGAPTPPPPSIVTPVAISTTSLPPAQANTPYSAVLNAGGGSGSYNWTLTHGALPPGLALDSALGVIAGTPSAAGSFTFDVTATDAADSANTATAALTLVVNGTASPVQIATPNVPGARETLPYSTTLQATGASGSFAWFVTSGSLPAGLTLSSSGELSGVPTSAGNYTFSVTAVDAANASAKATATYTVPVSAAVKILAPPSVLTPVRGKPFAYAVTAGSALGAAVWSLSGNLPQGFTFNTQSGVLSGVAKTGGSAPLRITVTDASTSDTITVTLKISQR
jgi:hypothetical protein